MSITVVFSCLFAEKIEYLHAYIDNFLAFTDNNCALVVNCCNNDDIFDIKNIGDRVVIHSGSTQRSKVGPTLLLGHLENFIAAREYFGAFAYFCATASNALFIERLQGDIVAQLMNHRGGGHSFDIEHLPAGWHWPKVKSDPIFLEYIRSIGLTTIRSSQIEGLCASQEDWERVADHRGFLDSAAQRGLQTFPYEEIFPITIIVGKGSGKFGILCHNFWSRFSTSAGAARFDDLIQPPSNFEQPLWTWGSNRVFAMKWFSRDLRDPITALLCRPNASAHLDILRDLLIRKPDDPIKLLYKEFYHKYLSDMREVDLFGPNNIFSIDRSQGKSVIYSNSSLKALRQIEYLDGLAGDSDRPHLYLEECDGCYDVELAIESSGSDNFLRTNCKRLNGAGGRTIIAYLYIPFRSLVSQKMLVSASINTDDNIENGEAERLTYSYNDTYSVMARDDEAVHTEEKLGYPIISYYIDLPLGAKHEYIPCYIGIPVIADANMSFWIRVHRAQPQMLSRVP